ncbi:FLZ-type domain-containing protein [Psidium guajava]|nr:FLZ-type domain-containing protein [Psidium guajava]
MVSHDKHLISGKHGGAPGGSSRQGGAFPWGCPGCIRGSLQSS